MQGELEGILRPKDEIAIERIRSLCPTGYTCAYSGGKDSTVLLDLAQRAGVPFQAVYNLTTADAPELVQHIMHQPDIIIDRPEHSIWRWCEIKAVPPTHVARWCCTVLKHRDTRGSCTITGIRWAESQRRHLRKMAEYHGHRRIINPIIDWTDDEVWRYIEDHRLPVCSLYAEGFKRLGCVGCPLATQKLRDVEFARWPKLRDAWIRALQAIWRVRKERGLELEESWNTPDTLVAWWMGGAYRERMHQNVCPGLFDDEEEIK